MIELRFVFREQPTGLNKETLESFFLITLDNVSKKVIPKKTVHEKWTEQRIRSDVMIVGRRQQTQAAIIGAEG